MARSISDETDPQNTVNGVVLNDLLCEMNQNPCDKIMIPSVQDVADLEPWPGCQVRNLKS